LKSEASESIAARRPGRKCRVHGVGGRGAGDGGRRLVRSQRVL